LRRGGKGPDFEGKNANSGETFDTIKKPGGHDGRRHFADGRKGTEWNDDDEGPIGKVGASSQDSNYPHGARTYERRGGWQEKARQHRHGSTAHIGRDEIIFLMFTERCNMTWLL